MLRAYRESYCLFSYGRGASQRSCCQTRACLSPPRQPALHIIDNANNCRARLLRVENAPGKPLPPPVQQPLDPLQLPLMQFLDPLQSNAQLHFPSAFSTLSHSLDLMASLMSSEALETTTTMMIMMMMMISRGMPMQRAQQIPQAQSPALAALAPSSLDDFPIFLFCCVTHRNK